MEIIIVVGAVVLWLAMIQTNHWAGEQGEKADVEIERGNIGGCLGISAGVLLMFALVAAAVIAFYAWGMGL